MVVGQLEKYPVKQRETHSAACIGTIIAQTSQPPNQS